MKNIKTLAVSRPVRIRFGSDWREGVISANDGQTITAVVGGSPVYIHVSVLARDLRVAR